VTLTVSGLDGRSLQLRKAIVETVASSSRRGHIASAFSVVEVLRVLYDEVLRYDPANPKWPGRDRFILSKGHGCLALYVLLAEKGFFPRSELQLFCKSEGILGGHPEHGKVPGVEFSTGSLGHGLPVGVGMAVAAKRDGNPHRVFAVIGDGESNEGSVWEAALSAAKHKLDNLTVLVDYNKQQSYGTTSDVLELEPFADKWRAFGFAVKEVDGHDLNQLRGVLGKLPLAAGKPSAIICHTVKGRGVSFVEKNFSWHHKNRVTDEELTALLSELEAEPI
jgi:transketolase